MLKIALFQPIITLLSKFIEYLGIVLVFSSSIFILLTKIFCLFFFGNRWKLVRGYYRHRHFKNKKVLAGNVVVCRRHLFWHAIKYNGLGLNMRSNWEGVNICIIGVSPTNLFWKQLTLSWFKNKLIGQKNTRGTIKALVWTSSCSVWCHIVDQIFLCEYASEFTVTLYILNILSLIQNST